MSSVDILVPDLPESVADAPSQPGIKNPATQSYVMKCW